MFSRQAIKSFSKQLEEIRNANQTDILGFKNMKILTDIIPKAQNYHMGSDKMIETVKKIQSKYDRKQKAFMGIAAHDVKLPYDICWFDFIDTNFLGNYAPEFTNTPLKIGMFVNKTNPEAPKDYPEIIFISPCFSYGPTKSWVLCSESIFVKVGDNYNVTEATELYYSGLITDAEQYPVEMSKRIKDLTSTNILHMPSILLGDDDYGKAWHDLGRKILEYSAAILNMFLMILNCQNVITDTIHTYTNKKKVKKINHSKGVTYKVLKFKLPKSSKRYEDQTDQQESVMPLHLCSGHWKTYTEERPLFGKVVGRWWWPSYMRGDKEIGEVKKDYHPEYAENINKNNINL